jgi:predicted Zn-dependent protease
MSIAVSRAICLGLVLASCCALAGAGRGIVALAQSAPNSPQTDIDSLQKRALEEGEAGRTDDAIRDYQRVLELRPAWKEGWWNLGMLQYDSARFAAAQATFSRVVALAPDLGIAWSLLGLSEYETAAYDAALPHLQKAQLLGIREDDEIARVSSYHLGILLTRASEFAPALLLLQKEFGAGVVSPQAKIALGLATLRVPLLPEQLDPSREALVSEAGAAAAADSAERFAALLRSSPDLPYLHLAYALALQHEGKNSQALAQLREETKVSPDSPIAWIELSRIELALNAPSEALHAAQQAVRISPADSDAHQALAQAWDATGAKAQAEAERKIAASADAGPRMPEPRMVRLYGNPHLDTARKVGAYSNEETWNRALLEFTAADYAAAHEDFKTWLAANPQNGNGWALLAICEFQLKDFDNALIHMDRSAKLGLSAKPEYLYLARYTYGLLLVHAGQFEQAAEVLGTAFDAAAPPSPKVEYALGLALLRRAEFPDAAGPQQAPMIAAAGRIARLLHESKYADAFPQFKALIAQYPHEPFLHYAYGTALIAMSEFDQAAAQMQAEAALSPQSELPCVRLASIALRQRDPATATTWAQRALQLAPGNVEAHYLLGRANLEAGDAAAAIGQLEIAARLSPASPEIHFNLAKAYARAKMPEKAQHERETFTRLNESQKANTVTQP